MVGKLLWGYLGFVVACLLLAALFSFLGNRSFEGLKISESGKMENQTIPGTFTERAAAPPLSLLPNRTASPAVLARADISPADIEALLARWESFSPRRQGAAQAKNQPDPYRQVIETISIEGQEALYRRLDSTDPPGVCPLVSCPAGLSWVPGSFGGLEIRDAQANQVYVTGYGVVTYQANVREGNPYQGQSFYRSYGLLLSKVEGRWYLNRAAAETVRAL